jgi:hypothetical protein
MPATLFYFLPTDMELCRRLSELAQSSSLSRCIPAWLGAEKRLTLYGTSWSRTARQRMKVWVLRPSNSYAGWDLRA